MPSEEERYAPPPSWVQEEARRATAEQFARDQVELSHALDHVELREITDDERQALREAKAAADVALAAKRSNVPERFAAVIDPTHPGVMDEENTVVAGLQAAYTDLVQAQANGVYRDQGLNRTRPDRVHIVAEYVRKDVADAERDEAIRLLRLLVDPDPCWFDHNGRCQAHALEKPCSDAAARVFLAQYDAARAACSEGDNDER